MYKKNNLIDKETLINIAWRAVQVISKQGVIFLIFLLSARYLSPYEFGVYNYVLAVVFFLILFGDFGISTATSKYVAEYNEQDKKKLRAVLFNSTFIIIVLGSLVTLLTVLIGPTYLMDKYAYVLYLLPLVFLAPITSLYDGIYRGLKKFRKLAIISFIAGIISLPITYVLINYYGIKGALISQIVFYLILCLMLALGYRGFEIKINRSVIKDIGKYSLIIGISGIGYFFQTRINVLILGHFGYISEVAYYELMNKFISFLIIPILVYSQVISPDITRLFLKNKEGVSKSYVKHLMAGLIFSVIILIIFLATIHPLIKIILPAYSNQTMDITLSVLFPLIITQYLSNLGAVAFGTSTGHAHVATWSLVICSIIGLPLSVILTANFGYVGILFSTLIVRVATDVSFIVIYGIKLGKISNV